ncbi:hypothetical protein Golomagni_05025 [Golovinomyces magnicellulatus]|nr:hypothetical protein Golomagni_05025 [Golovinomyces magnicellulatus]
MTDVRIEEVNESDPSEGNISDLSDDDFNELDILRARLPLSKDGTYERPMKNPRSNQDQLKNDNSSHANFQCIYPIYFDKLRSRRQGRMVGKELAVENPMAREIVNSCGYLGLETVFEPTKCHPRDWANPGRVRVNLHGGRNPNIKNKHHLYILISKHLKANPTTVASARTMLIPGVPPPDPSKEYSAPAVPRGWKIGSILPYYSPALTDGGVSEDMFKQMFSQMQNSGAGTTGGVPAGLPDMSALQGLLGAAASSSAGASSSQEKTKKKVKRKA